MKRGREGEKRQEGLHQGDLRQKTIRKRDMEKSKKAEAIQKKTQFRIDLSGYSLMVRKGEDKPISLVRKPKRPSLHRGIYFDWGFGGRKGR